MKRSYKGVGIRSTEGTYKTYSASFYVTSGLIHLLGVKKLKTIKKLIDTVLEDEELKEDAF